MDPQIASRFTDSMLQSAAQFYNFDAAQAEALDGFESFIYKFTRPDGKFILRIGHSDRRSPELICGEVDWINYLAAGGAGVARAVHSQAGNLVEAVEDGQGGQFLCTAFEHAPGEPARREKINDRLYLNYGRMLGRMHTLSKSYRVSNPAWRRPDWDNPENTTAGTSLAASHPIALGQYLSVIAHLRGLPCDSESFGMIHQDAHPGNFFVDDDYRLTLFDFDDCVYGHFIYDIAMVLFYTSQGVADPAAYTAKFMPVFLAGYREENQLSPAWLPELPHFMKLREIDLFAAILLSNGDGSQPLDPWSERYMRGRQQRIESGQPLIDFDWSSLAGSL